MNRISLITRQFFTLMLVFALQAALFAQDSAKKVALTTFFVDRQINVSELSTNAALVADMLTMAKDTNFNLQPILDAFKTNFFTEYAKHFPFTLKPEADVLENKDYQNYDEAFTSDFLRPLTPKGYKVMYPGGFLTKKENRNQNEMLRIFPDADGVMYVFLSYGFVKKVAIGGLGAAGIYATCNIWLYNKEGKSVFKIAEGANSKGTVPLVGGIPIMSVDRILPLCKDASARLFDDLMDKLPKIAKKAEKKL